MHAAVDRQAQTAFWLFLVMITGLLSCHKPATEPSPDPDPLPYQLNYGDSILFLKQQSADYIVMPTEQRPGTYIGFPDGIQLDEKTGAINLSKSETGLRYRISHISTSGDTTSTLVVLSGITYVDHLFYLEKGDSLARPVYNANPNRSVPVTGSVFDESGLASGGGCAIKNFNAEINLAETIRNEVFGKNPVNDVRKDFDIDYRLNDKSGKALNKLRVRLYYYDKESDVPSDLWETLNDRQTQNVFLRQTTSPIPAFFGTAARSMKIAKPRPPCVVIIAH